MEITTNTNWTKEELFTYLLIYCMNADFKESVEELEIIITKVGFETFKKLDLEFERDSDYTSIQKIRNSLEEYKLTEKERDNLFEKIKELFLSDGKYEILERNLMLGLKRLL